MPELMDVEWLAIEDTFVADLRARRSSVSHSALTPGIQSLPLPAMTKRLLHVDSPVVIVGILSIVEV